MPEAYSRRRSLLAAGIGVALAVLAGVGGIVAALAGWLAQPAFALAMRGSRKQATPMHWQRDALALLLLWGAGLLVAALLVVWPLNTLRASATLGHALTFSGVVGIALIALWRLWPLWHALECDGGRLGDRWRALARLRPAPGAVSASPCWWGWCWRRRCCWRGPSC